MSTIRILALVLGLGVLPRAEADPLAPWTLGVHAQALQVEDDAGAADRGGGLRFTLGRQLGDELTLELDVGQGRVDLEAGGELDQVHGALNVLLVNRVPSWNPYFLIGVGGFRDELPGLSDTGPMAQLAVGGMWDLNGYGLMLRADLRYRYLERDDDRLEAGEPVLSLGLEFPFGRP